MAQGYYSKDNQSLLHLLYCIVSRRFKFTFLINLTKRNIDKINLFFNHILIRYTYVINYVY